MLHVYVVFIVVLDCISTKKVGSIKFYFMNSLK